MAIEYFQSGKYHEALLLFQRLDKQYRLNPRFRAYIGVCYYYEWDYKRCCQYLDTLMEKLEVFAPHERAVYYFTDAESHFQLGEYGKAAPLYEQMLTVCFDNEKPECLYRLGFCYLFAHDEETALEYFHSALAYYERYRNTPEAQPRIEQLKKMAAGLEAKGIGSSPTDTPQVTTVSPDTSKGEGEKHESAPSKE